MSGAARDKHIAKLPPEARRLKGMDEADKECLKMLDCLKKIRPNLRADYLHLFLIYAHQMGGIKAKQRRRQQDQRPAH